MDVADYIEFSGARGCIHRRINIRVCSTCLPAASVCALARLSVSYGGDPEGIFGAAGFPGATRDEERESGAGEERREREGNLWRIFRLGPADAPGHAASSRLRPAPRSASGETSALLGRLPSPPPRELRDSSSSSRLGPSSTPRPICQRCEAPASSVLEPGSVPLFDQSPLSEAGGTEESPIKFRLSFCHSSDPSICLAPGGQ